ncbi:MAG: DNA repair protein RadA [Lachnospiraceae bacterium]|nr:DNA repair protein RadA [Lachnospiraceae bacterium]
MAKAKSVFFCKECGAESPKWLGQCPACKAWDSMVEEPNAGKKSINKAASASPVKRAMPEKLSTVKVQNDLRIVTGVEEFDRVLGGGIVDSSLVLVGGDPGIGKSTLLLQICRILAGLDVDVLYISGEESVGQIKMRADRLGDFKGDIELLSENNLDNIEELVIEKKPRVVVIDSIQTMFREDIAAAPGSVSQVRETTGSLLRLAKGYGITIFIVGHVTKEGVVAGPRVLEHMVDTVLYFEGDNSTDYRVLRAVKNRFGSTNEVGVFEMRSDGLREVRNPSEYMLAGTPVGEPGSVITATIEGTRPIMLEIQALCCQTALNIPRRTSVGIDYNRVNLLMAVLEKKLGLKLSFCDAYVNVAGGMKVNEPALDLAIVMALLSSYSNKALGEKTIVFGEVGLTGEVRGVSQAEQRVAEAKQLGFESIILPKVNLKSVKNCGLKLTGVGHITELMRLF